MVKIQREELARTSSQALMYNNATFRNISTNVTTNTSVELCAKLCAGLCAVDLSQILAPQ